MSGFLGTSFDCGRSSGGLTVLPADSSGILPTSSPSASSDSSSGSYSGRVVPMATLSLNTRPSQPLFARPGAPGKNLSLMTKASRRPEKKAPPPSAPEPSRRPSALFLTQFEEQMSQMKNAMDAVQKELSTSTPAPEVVPRGRGRPAKNPALISPTYHSQISTTNGLVIKIRKAATVQKVRGPRKGGAKKKKKRVDEDIVYCGDSEDEDEDFEIEPKKKKRDHQEFREMEEPNEGSGWGKTLPLPVLRRILRLVVGSEGAVPSLVRASRVSRLWREATLDPSLWTSVDLSTEKVKDKYRSERNLIYFLENKFSHAVQLNLGGWSSAVTPAAVDVLVQTCPFLESLNLSTCYKLSAQNVNSIAESCRHLSKLDLSAVSSAYNTRNAVSPSGIGEAAEVFGNRLLHLSLASNCMGNLPQVLASLAEHCGNLQVLDLSSISSPRRDTIFIRIEDLQIGCPSLRILRLTNSDIVLGETSIKDQMTSPGFARLEELSIAVDPKRSQGMGDNDLERIVKKSLRLRLLDARGCARISDSGLVRLPAWDLEHLYLSGSFATKSSTDGLELIFKKWCHSLKEVDISWTPSEETVGLGLKALVEGQPTPIRSLDLTGSSVSFESVRLLLQATPALQTINLTSCRALPRGIKRNYQSPVEVYSLREQVAKFHKSNHSSADQSPTHLPSTSQ